MSIKHILLALSLLLAVTSAKAGDYKQSPEYLALRDSMHHAFNDGDSVRFFPALKALQDYLLEQGDLHAYYTQRCNEIVFEMTCWAISTASAATKKQPSGISTELST